MAESPLRRALRLQQEAAGEDFDWDSVEAMWPKIEEEIAELRAAVHPAAREEELGDLLFIVINLARHLEVDAEAALHAANAKFERRFAHVMAATDLPPLGDSDRLARMEARWQEAKKQERKKDKNNINK